MCGQSSHVRSVKSMWLQLLYVLPICSVFCSFPPLSLLLCVIYFLFLLCVVDQALCFPHAPFSSASSSSFIHSSIAQAVRWTVIVGLFVQGFFLLFLFYWTVHLQARLGPMLQSSEGFSGLFLGVRYFRLSMTVGGVKGRKVERWKGGSGEN